MEFVNQVSSYFTPETVALAIVILFVVGLFFIRGVARAMSGNNTVDWEALGNHLAHIVVTVAFTPQDIAAAKEMAADYTIKVGRPVDWRMAIVLKQAENYVERYVPVDVDLITLAYFAEGIYFEIKDSLEGRIDKETEEETVVEAEVSGLS
jgi:hypothetical protein